MSTQINTTGACAQCHQRWDYEERRCDRCRLNWPADDADEDDDFAIVEMALRPDAAGSPIEAVTSPASSPVGGGGVLAGVPSALILAACERYEAAAWFASPAVKAIAASELVAELRALAQPKRLPDFKSQAEYDFYTTLMEQAEERKS